MREQKPESTTKQKVERPRLRKEYMWIFVREKQKRVCWPAMIDSIDVDEFILRNA